MNSKSTGIGERVKNRRLELGLTQIELAKRMGYESKAAICKVERGDDNITLDRVSKFATALNVEPGYLMGWNEEAEPTKENAVTLASIMKDKTLLNYIKKIMSLPAKKKEALYKYIDFLFSSDD